MKTKIKNGLTRVALSSLSQKILFCVLVGNVFLCHLPAKLQPILHVDADLFFSPIFHAPKNDYYIDVDHPLGQEKIYGNYHLDKLKSSSDLAFNVGFVARPDRNHAGHSVFGLYEISHLTLIESELKSRLFHHFCDFSELYHHSKNYSEYLQGHLSRFLWQKKMLPFDDWLHSSGQLINQIFFSYSHSILNALDFSTGASFLSLLPKGAGQQKRSDHFERSELYMYNLGFFVRPLSLGIQPKFDENLEMSFFAHYTFRAKPKAQTSFEDSTEIADAEKQSLQFGNNQNIFSGNWGLFYEKRYNKVHIRNSAFYQHQINFYGERNGITKKTENMDENLYTVNEKQWLQKNSDRIENTFSLEFLLPKKTPKSHQSTITLTLSDAFGIEYSQKGLWEHSPNTISADNLSLPHHHFVIQASPFPIFDARVFDHFTNNLKAEIKYLFHQAALVFLDYQWTTTYYYRLSQMARKSENYRAAHPQNIAKDAHVENSHAIKLGFQYLNDFIERVEPYLFYVKSTNGTFSPKKNQDFWGIGIQFTYLLHPTNK